MDIGKFVDEFVKQKDDSSKTRFVKKHVTKTYLPYVKKIDEAKKIIDYSCHIKGENSFAISSPVRYMLFAMSVINEYTDLEFNLENSPEQFDLIEKNNIMNYIVDCIGEDYKRYNTVLAMTYDDMMINERSLTSFVEEKLNVLATAIEAMDVPTE